MKSQISFSLPKLDYFIQINLLHFKLAQPILLFVFIVNNFQEYALIVYVLKKKVIDLKKIVFIQNNLKYIERKMF